MNYTYQYDESWLLRFFINKTNLVANLHKQKIQYFFFVFYECNKYMLNTYILLYKLYNVYLYVHLYT